MPAGQSGIPNAAIEPSCWQKMLLAVIKDQLSPGNGRDDAEMDGLVQN